MTNPNEKLRLLGHGANALKAAGVRPITEAANRLASLLKLAGAAPQKSLQRSNPKTTTKKNSTPMPWNHPSPFREISRAGKRQSVT